MAHIDIRPVAVDERHAAADTIRAALLTQPATDELMERRRAAWDASDALAAWDGERCVGHVSALRLDTTVPGGARLPTAGVTRVGTLPTHTRRGLVRSMLERLLRESRERGRVLASLRASETTIYGRFGFGLATDDEAVTITAALARPLRAAPTPGSVRMLAQDELFDTIPALYDRCARWRVGTISRDRWMWEIELEQVAKPSSVRTDRSVVAAVHADDRGTDDGYVIYEAGWDDQFGENPSASGLIRELFGIDAAAERALWDFVLDVDLVRTWNASTRPVGDPIRRAFNDHRAYETRRRLDEVWIRALDLDAALGARTYGPAHGGVVIEVVDPLFDDNCGRWRIAADGAARTNAAADLAVDIAAISAAYLGGVSWRGLADSGEIGGDVDGEVLGRLDALFAVHPAPFCGTDY